ncbi:MAG: amidohydrolase family protein [Acidobacteriia bacterium]|nr:amidohydrolase family protein [Terriglobia bacterium]
MKSPESPEQTSAIGRRDFMKIGAGGAGALMTALPAAAAADEPSQAWWEAHPGKAGAGKPVSIDLHTHWSPTPYTKALADLGRPIENPYPLDYDLAKRIEWMDEHGAQVHCLTLSGAMPWQWTSSEQAARLATIINDAGIEAHIAHPDRFLVGVELPIRDPKLALVELNRVAGKPGVRAVHLPDAMERHDYLFDPQFADVFSRIEELGYPILFHQMDEVVNAYGGELAAGPRYLNSGLDAAIQHTIIASKLVVTGTLDRHPKLEIVLPHGGGAFPYLAGRVDHFINHFNGPEFKPTFQLAMPFKNYLRRFHYDYLIYYPEAFHFLAGLVGTDRIVVGTDLFAAKDVQYPNQVLDQFKLSPADRDRILKGNASRLLHL